MFEIILQHTNGTCELITKKDFSNAVSRTCNLVRKETKKDFYDDIFYFIFHSEPSNKTTLLLGTCSMKLVKAPVRGLAVSITEVSGDGNYFGDILTGRDEKEVIKVIRKFFDTEASERKLTFSVNWWKLEEDIARGNTSSGPYIMKAEGYDSDWVITSEVITL